MKRTLLLALVMAAATWGSADTMTGRQRIQLYARLVAASPVSSTVMVERIDGTLWTFRVDPVAARELARLHAGDEVALTFIYDGPGAGDADVVRDFDLLPVRQRAGWPLPFGLTAGLSLAEAGYVRTAGTVSRTGVPLDYAAAGTLGQAMDADLALDGRARGAGLVTGGTVTTGPTTTTLPGLTTPGPVLLDGRNLTASASNITAGGIVDGATTADSLAVGSFTPGSVAPNVENPAATFPSSGQLARPAADSGFTPGVTSPGVRDTAAGRAGVPTDRPRAEGSFTPGNLAPGVPDLSGAGRETLTTGVPAVLVTPNSAVTNTGNQTVGGTGGTTVTGGTPTGTTPATGGTTTTTTTGTGTATPAGNGTHGGTTATPGTASPSTGHAGTTTSSPTTTTGTGSTAGAGTKAPSTGTTGSSTTTSTGGQN